MDAGTRRLHAKSVEAKHGVKIQAFERLGGVAFAEMKNATAKQFCQMFLDLDNDPVVEYVEEDLMWLPLGNKLQVEDMLFPPPRPQPEPKLHGRMHRRPGVCGSSTCGRTEGHPNDVDFADLWGLHQDTRWHSGKLCNLPYGRVDRPIHRYCRALKLTNYNPGQ